MCGAEVEGEEAGERRGSLSPGPRLPPFSPSAAAFTNKPPPSSLSLHHSCCLAVCTCRDRLSDTNKPSVLHATATTTPRPPYCRIGGIRHVLPSPLTASQPTNTDSLTGHDRPFSPPIPLLPLCNISPRYSRTTLKTKPVLENQFLLFLNSLFEPP